MSMLKMFSYSTLLTQLYSFHVTPRNANCNPRSVVTEDLLFKPQFSNQTLSNDQ